jgi:hypothetical protein
MEQGSGELTSRPEPSDDILWKQYALHVDLYKFYMDLALRFNIFYYAVTGAILSYYFARADVPWMKWTLGFPCLMSLAFATVFIFGATRIEVVRDELFSIRDKLGLETAPEYKVLTLMLSVCAAMFVLVTLGLCYMMLFLGVPPASTVKP